MLRVHEKKVCGSVREFVQTHACERVRLPASVHVCVCETFSSSSQKSIHILDRAIVHFKLNV